MSKEAMKLALEALKSCDAAHITDGGRQWYDEKLVDKAVEAIEKALAEQPAPMIRGDIRNGLVDDEPAHQHIEHCLWARNGNQPCPHVQPAQQEPVAKVIGHSKLENESVSLTPRIVAIDQSLQVNTMLYTSPPAQCKPLTDEQWQSIADTLGCIITRSQKDAIEAKLEERTHDRT